MRFVMMAVLAVFCLGLPGDSSACQFDTDCEVGSKCVKPEGSLNGWCVGGLKPGNANDKKPAHDPLDVTGKKGDTCNYDTDCGPGGRCVKGDGILGTCL